MSLAPAVVADAIRLLFDREPDGDHEIAWLARWCPDLPTLRRHLLGSEEFVARNPDLVWSDETSPVIVTLDDGVRVFVDLADRAVGIPIAKRRFELNELEFVRRTVREGQHVVDGGAHVGLFALTAARLVGPSGHVVAFEPVAGSASLLARGIVENDFVGIVSLERAALARSSGTGVIVTPDPSFSPGAAYLWRTPGPLPPRTAHFVVPTIALDEYPVPRPLHFVRLDVEGAEGVVLRGAARLLAEDRPVVLSEVHVDLLQPEHDPVDGEWLGWMRAIGYRCHALGAGAPGAELDALPSSGVHTIVFLP